MMICNGRPDYPAKQKLQGMSAEDYAALREALPLGRLPGDIAIQRGHFSFYFPLASCLLVSVLLSVLLWFFSSHR